MYRARQAYLAKRGPRKSTSYTSDEVRVQVEIIERLSRGADLSVLIRSDEYRRWVKKVMVLADKIPGIRDERESA